MPKLKEHWLAKLILNWENARLLYIFLKMEGKKLFGNCNFLWAFVFLFI